MQKNAIERRLDYLGGLWNEFAQNSQTRMLRWLTDPDEVRMIELFIDIQSEEIGEIPDLFIRFDTPFTDTQMFGFQLIAELKKQYEEIRNDIAREGIISDWECPRPLHGESDQTDLLQVCTSLHEYYKGLMEQLVLFLTPTSISNINEFQKWLLLFVRSGLPETIRITVIDLIDSPQLDLLCKTEQKLITTVEPKLDMPDAYEELAEQPQGVGPGYKFRRHFVALLNASAKGDINRVNQSATAALNIATKQNWQQMQVVIHMALGATYLNRKDIEKALESYRLAKNCAEKAQESADPAGPKLLIQAMFAEGGALFSGGQFTEAAKVYEEIAPLTEKQEDHLMTVEGWRMAAYCHEMAKNKTEACRCGNRALDAGSRLDEEMRKNTTLPYVGQRLLRLLYKDKEYRDLENTVRRRMIELVGPDWEKKLATKVHPK